MLTLQQTSKDNISTVINTTVIHRGFTLAEVLVAMLITSILILGANAALRQTALIWSHAENRRPIYQDARFLTELLRNELAGLYLPPQSDNATEPFVLLPNKMEFHTLTPSFKETVASSRIARVRYEFVNNMLRRFEQPYAAEKQLGRERSDLMLQGLSTFTFLAFDQEANKWKDTYISNGVPPRAIKVSLAWPESKDIPAIGFETTYLICSQTTLAY